MPLVQKRWDVQAEYLQLRFLLLVVVGNRYLLHVYVWVLVPSVSCSRPFRYRYRYANAARQLLSHVPRIVTSIPNNSPVPEYATYAMCISSDMGLAAVSARGVGVVSFLLLSCLVSGYPHGFRFQALKTGCSGHYRKDLGVHRAIVDGEGEEYKARNRVI